MSKEILSILIAGFGGFLAWFLITLAKNMWPKKKNIAIKYSVYYDNQYKLYKIKIDLFNQGMENLYIKSVNLEGKNYSEDIHFHELETPILPNASKIDQYGLSEESIKKTNNVSVYFNADKKEKVKINLKKEIEEIENDFKTIK